MIDKSINFENRMDSKQKNRFKDKYKLSLDTQKFILQTSWAQHDGQWYLKSISEIGIDEANILNQKVIYSMGKIEARHVLNALNIQKGTINTIPEIFKILNTMMEVIIPKIMKFEFIVLSDKEGLGIVKRCFIWKMVQKAKGESTYKCACNFRHRGWLEAIGINGEIIALKRISEGDEFCKFKFIIKENG